MSKEIDSYKASCVYKGSGEDKVLKGHLAFNPSGHLVQLSPGSLKIQASVERGTFVSGLKDGWKLATQADFKKAGEEAARAKKKGAA